MEARFDTSGLLIRKISINDPKEGISYVVGRQVGRNITVTDIVFDPDFHAEYGIPRYHIFADNGIKNGLWKTIENIPVLIEYDLDPESALEL
jgi:hypothetical protein